MVEGWPLLPKAGKDGAQLQLKSVMLDKYLAAELGGGTVIVANRPSASGWETFPLWRINENSFRMRVFNKQFLGLDSTGINLVATSTDSEKSGIFEIIRKSDDPSLVRIKAPNGLFLQAKTEYLVTADSKGDGQWGNDDPSVFKMTISPKFKGEFQVTNGHGPLKAPQIMKNDKLVVSDSSWACKTRTFILGDKPHSFFAPDGKPPRQGLNPRPLACGNNLPKFTFAGHLS
ncbi:probable glucan 1,3-beta-glucosidase A [Tanacetum coccineum]